MNVVIEPSGLEPGEQLSDVTSIMDALFTSLGVEGVYARSALYERVIDSLGALITRRHPADAEVLRFPPVMSRRDVERSGYLKSFPNLLGCVSVFSGGDAQIRESLARIEKGADWAGSLSAADLVLSPAACYPVYPLVAQRGRLPRGGLIFDVQCDCFRREPSPHPDRLQSFRMREYVRIGSADEVSAFRAEWMEHGRSLASTLGLSAKVSPANDPFFGREGQMRSVSQIQLALKFELLIPTWSQERPTACLSFNCHRDHFGAAWNIRDETGEVAHTACVAFGIDRLALALFYAHGLKIEAWPSSVRNELQI